MEAYVIIQYQLCVTLKGQVSARRRLPEFGVRQNATSRQVADLFAPRLPSMMGGEQILGGRFRQDSLCACSAVACRVIRPSIIEGPWPHGTPCIGPNTIQERADGAVLQRVSLRRTCCSWMCYVEHSGEDSHCQWLDMRAQPSAADRTRVRCSASATASHSSLAVTALRNPEVQEETLLRRSTSSAPHSRSLAHAARRLALC